MNQSLIKKVEIKQPQVNYFKLGLGALISYMVTITLISRNVFDWYIITLAMFIFWIVFAFMYYFFIRDKKIYLVKGDDKNESIGERKDTGKKKLDKSKDIKQKT